MNAKKSFVVMVECKIIKQLTCEDCTEEEAEENPFEHATDEMEVSQEDWEVLEVRPNV